MNFQLHCTVKIMCYVGLFKIMMKIQSNTFLGISIILGIIGLGLITSQHVYAQEITTGAGELQSLVTTMAGIFTTIAAIAGSVIASYAKMSQKLGTLKEGEAKKLLYLADELKGTDQWSKEIVKDLNAVVDVIANLPEGKKLLEQKRIDLKVWNEEATKLDTDLDEIHKKLLKLVLEK